MDIQSVNTILYCTKWNETVSFYKTKLKFKVSFSNPWFIEFKLNETSRLSIADEKRASIGSSSGKGHTITMKIDDVQQIYSELKDGGLNPTAVKEKWGAKVIYIHDPENNRLEFWSENHVSY